MDMNAESILDALNDFERKPTEISPILEDYLLRIAQNGEIIFPWSKLKPLLKKKLEIVCDEFNATNMPDASSDMPNFDNFHFETLKKSILQAVDAFSSAPFTIQRLCELVTNPKKHYNRTDKYMRGIEKNVLVVSTIEPRTGVQNDANANNPVVNGMISDSPRDDNECFNTHDNNHENISSSNLNSPANHVLLDNFANVFPSAACIPSPSNICMSREMDSINRELDSNFLPTPECGIAQEEEFAPQVTLELTEHAEPKDEQMDTTSEEEQSSSSDKCELVSADAEQVVDAEETKEEVKTEEQNTNVEESVDEDLKEEVSETSVEDVSDSENVKIEADCSESSSDSSDKAIPEKEPAESSQCQQDDTVSQSDDNVCDASEVSQSDEACEVSAISSADETKSENAPEVSQSTTSNNSSEQCMELESSSEESSDCK